MSSKNRKKPVSQSARDDHPRKKVKMRINHVDLQDTPELDPVPVKPKKQKSVMLNDLVGEVSNQKLATRAAMLDSDFGRVNINFKTERQRKLATAIDDNTLVFTTGEAGTGKSFVAVYKALEMLASDDNTICRLYLAKPAQTIPGEDIGFLPGSMEDKMSVFVYSMKAIIGEIIGEEACEALFEKKIIQILPIAFIRGVTLKNAVILIDEMQNCTTHTVKSIVTRIGEGSKMICTGDLGQIDIKMKPGQICGLDDAIRFLPNIPNVGFVQFEPEDCVRSEIVKNIVHAYRTKEAANPAPVK